MHKQNEPKNKSLLGQRINSFRYAFQGIFLALRSEVHLQFHCVAALLVCTLGLCFGITRLEWFMVLVAISLVLVTELFNTALEKLVDLVSPEEHTLAGQAKDIAAGAVLIAALFAAVTGGVVFCPYLLK